MSRSESNDQNVPARRSLFGVDPFRDFFDQPLRLSRVFDRPFGALSEGVNWSPAMDVQESKDAYVATVELPGAKKEDITIECHENVLTIKGEKKSEREEHDEHRHYTERTYGSFSRSLRLPADAADDVKASFKDGVLTVEIPKAAERKPRAVAIES